MRAPPATSNIILCHTYPTSSVLLRYHEVCLLVDGTLVGARPREYAVGWAAADLMITDHMQKPIDEAIQGDIGYSQSQT